MGKVLRFPSWPVPKPDAANGRIEIYPSDADGGCWAVYHLSKSESSIGHCGDFFSYADAEKAARIEARRRGALFDEGAPAA